MPTRTLAAPLLLSSGVHHLVFFLLLPASLLLIVGVASLPDNVSPTVLSGVSLTGGTVTPTNAKKLFYTVTFSEPVQFVTASSFTASNSGVPPGTLLVNLTSGTQGTAGPFRYDVSGMVGAGTITTGVKTSGSGIKDMAGNNLGASFGATPAVVWDSGPPTTTGVYRDANKGTFSPSNQPNLYFTLSFNKIVNGLNMSSFLISSTTGGTVVPSQLAGSGAGPYTFRLTGMAAPMGVISVGVKPTGNFIRDIFTNDLTSVGQTITVTWGTMNGTCTVAPDTPCPPECGTCGTTTKYCNFWTQCRKSNGLSARLQWLISSSS